MTYFYPDLIYRYYFTKEKEYNKYFVVVLGEQFSNRYY